MFEEMKKLMSDRNSLEKIYQEKIKWSVIVPDNMENECVHQIGATGPKGVPLL